MASAARNVTVVIPAAAGRSGPAASRPPTWCLERPDGRLVIVSVIRQLDLSHVDRVVTVVLRRDVDDFCGGDVAALETFVADAVGADALGECKVTFLPLDEPTASAADTVRAAIDALGVTHAVFVKDCDGAFRHTVTAENCVVALSVTSATIGALHDLPSKSFVEECGGVLTNIVEKHIVNDLVCVGGYGFASAAAFLRALDAVAAVASRTDRAGGSLGRVFTSHLVLHLLLEEAEVFRVAKVAAFDDWKTREAWRANARKHRNVVVHLEGVLVVPKPHALAARVKAASSSPAGADLRDQFAAVEENIAALNARVAEFASGTRVVLLSSRPEASRAAVEALCTAYGIRYDALVLGMQAAASSLLASHDELMLPHPAATAVSIGAGAPTLADVLPHAP